MHCSQLLVRPLQIRVPQIEAWAANASPSEANGAVLFATEADAGTQKTFSAVYSSRLSGSAFLSFSSAAWRPSNASDSYLRKMKPRATCLYPAASRRPRILSAAAKIPTHLMVCIFKAAR